VFKIVIDRSLCSGFGACIDAAPLAIELDDEGLARVVVRETDDEAVLDAASACPMGAIEVREVEAA